MSYYWASILSAFLPTTLLLAAHWAVRRPYGPWPTLLSCVGALVLGVGLSHFLPATQVATLGLLLVQLVLLAGFLVWQFSRARGGLWQIALVAVAAVHWGKSPALSSLTATHIINTDFLLNLASAVVVFAACMLLGWLLCLVLRLLPRGRWPLLIGAGTMVAVPLSGNIVLSLMKLQVLELTRARLSFAAKATNLDGQITYWLLLLVAVLLVAAAIAIIRPRRQAWRAEQQAIARRIALASYRQARRLAAATAVIALAMLSGQGYWDAVASRPPALSEATRVDMTPDGQVRLALAPLMDGNLHRFAWVADDGKVVRFFVINRLDDRVAPAVVLDACLLCGDKGYVQQGNQVVCVGCGVYMFKPSIGKPGGCNPVPVMNWVVEGEQIVIPKAALETGLQLFSTVLTIEVTDPVSGKKLANTSAPHRYTYAGKTYFFADETAFAAFRDDPEKYIATGAMP